LKLVSNSATYIYLAGPYASSGFETGQGFSWPVPTVPLISPKQKRSTFSIKAAMLSSILSSPTHPSTRTTARAERLSRGLLTYGAKIWRARSLPMAPESMLRPKGICLFRLYGMQPAGVPYARFSSCSSTAQTLIHTTTGGLRFGMLNRRAGLMSFNCFVRRRGRRGA